MNHTVIFWVITLCSLGKFSYILYGPTSWETKEI